MNIHVAIALRKLKKARNIDQAIVVIITGMKGVHNETILPKRSRDAFINSNVVLRNYTRNQLGAQLMPCSDSNGQDKWFEERFGTTNPDKLRDMLCRTLREIEYQSPGVVLDQDIKDWFVKHKKWDSERK